MSMGWRPGQGVGPRLNRRQRSRRQSSHARLFGPMFPDSAKRKDSDGDDDADAEDDEFRLNFVKLEPKYPLFKNIQFHILIAS